MSAFLKPGFNLCQAHFKMDSLKIPIYSTFDYGTLKKLDYPVGGYHILKIYTQ